MKFRIIDVKARAYCKVRDEAVIAAVRDGELDKIGKLITDTHGVIPNDTVLMATACKMCCNIVWMPEYLRKKAFEWLNERGMSTDIY